jgi:cerevisin
MKLNGSCTYGIDLIDGSNVDGNGHGTHVAGTAAGKTYGVAKFANLIAVRVLDDRGGGSVSDIVNAIDW